MRIPDPKANTTTEAYLAYKAGYLEESELKPVLYEPYLHFDAWLAYWAGLTNTYPLDKNGNPEMLTDEEALVAYLSGVTDTYPEEIKDPYDVRIVGYLKYLVSARWGRPEYPVNNEEFYLSTMKPPVVPSGDPSTSIELDGTVEAPFIDLKMYGDTFQQTYTGKNLLPLTGFDYSSGGLTSTNNGSTVSISGTTTTEYATITGQTALGSTIPSGTDVTLSMTSALPAGVRLYMRIYGVVGSSYTNLAIEDGETSVSTTLGRDFGRYQFLIRSTAGTTLNISNLGIQIETGSTATSFEPYVGGTPSPNPDYPQDINVVTGEQTVAVNGKNLFSALSATGTTSGIEWIRNVNSITVTGSSSTSTAWRFMDNGVDFPEFPSVIPAGTYTLSVGSISGATSAQTLSFQFRDSDNTSILTGQRVGPGATSITVNLTRDAYYFRVSIEGLAQNTPVDISYNDIMLEAGSTATAYEPYQGQSYTVNLGSTELCKIGDKQDYIYQNNGEWYLHREVRHLSLLVADMNNNNSYPGWTNQTLLREDIGLRNNPLLSYTKYTSNLNDGSYNQQYNMSAVSINTTGTQNVVYLSKSYFDRVYGGDWTQDYWKTTYPNLTFDLYYAIINIPEDEKITEQTLIDQLEAIIEGGSYNSKTYIKVTATEPNLPGLLYVEAGKYD